MLQCPRKGDANSKLSGHFLQGGGYAENRLGIFREEIQVVGVSVLKIKRGQSRSAGEEKVRLKRRVGKPVQNLDLKRSQDLDG